MSEEQCEHCSLIIDTCMLKRSSVQITSLIAACICVVGGVFLFMVHPAGAQTVCSSDSDCPADQACNASPLARIKTCIPGVAVGGYCGEPQYATCARGLSCVNNACAAAPSAETDAERGLIIGCALADPSVGGYCNDVNDILLQLIRIGDFLFQIIGALAFLFFIY